MDDAALVQATLHGDVEAFAMLAHGYQRALVASARYLTGNMDDAEDLAQEALLKAYQGMPTLQDPARFRPWVFAILRHLCFTHLQRRPAATASLDDAAESLAAPEAPDGLAISLLLDRLPPAYREILVAHYMMGLSYTEIATTQKTTLETVQMRAFRARALLKKFLCEEEEEERRLLTMAMGAVPLSSSIAFTGRVLVEVKQMNVQTPSLSGGMTTPGTLGAIWSGLLNTVSVKVAGVILLALFIPVLYLATHRSGAIAYQIKSEEALSLPADITIPVTGNNPVKVRFPVIDLDKEYLIRVYLTSIVPGASHQLTARFFMFSPTRFGRDYIYDCSPSDQMDYFELITQLDQKGTWSVLVSPTSPGVASVRVTVNTRPSNRNHYAKRRDAETNYQSAIEDLKKLYDEHYRSPRLVTLTHCPLLFDLTRQGNGPFTVKLDMTKYPEEHYLHIRLLPETTDNKDTLTAQASLLDAKNVMVKQWNILEILDCPLIHQQTYINELAQSRDQGLHFRQYVQEKQAVTIPAPGIYTLTVTPSSPGIAYIEIDTMSYPLDSPEEI